MFQFVKIVGRCREKVAGRDPAIFSANYLAKRNAGHSKAANRKGVKKESGQRISAIKEKLRKDLYREVNRSQNTNLESNPRLQAIWNEAHKASITADFLDKYLKTLDSFIKKENVESYVFQHTLGITYVVEISELTPADPMKTRSLMKKFGFEYVGLSSETLKLVGLISCKPSENITKSLDKALEDAITANCEEVLQKDEGNFEFICDESELHKCKKMLEDIGYEINNIDKKYVFPNYVKVAEPVLQKLEKLQEKFDNTAGFLRVSHNIEK